MSGPTLRRRHRSGDGGTLYRIVILDGLSGAVLTWHLERTGVYVDALNGALHRFGPAKGNIDQG